MAAIGDQSLYLGRVNYLGHDNYRGHDSQWVGEGGGGDALIGIAERDLAGAGITRVGRVEGERGGMPVCGDRVIEPRVIIWCTGFRPDYAWIDAPVFDADGRLLHERGVRAKAPGLFFLGLRFQHRLSSSLIGGVGDDARFVAEHVAKRCEAVLDEEVHVA